MKKKVLILLLIVAIVCSLFAFVACKDPNAQNPGKENGNESEISGGEQNQPSDDDNQPSGGNDEPSAEAPIELMPANQNYKGEEVDYALYFETDGNGKIISLSDYAIQERNKIVQIKIPKKIGNEDITAINIGIIDDIPFLRILEIPNQIVKVEKNDVVAIPFAVIYCEAASKPSDWTDDWNEVDDGMVEHIPVIWNCNNNEVADDGNIYGISSDGMLLALKDGKAKMVFSGRSEEENIILNSNYIYKDNQYEINDVMAYSYVSIFGTDEYFQNCQNVKRITLPNSLENIGVCAFAFCQAQEFVFPKMLKHIGDYGFGFSGITKAVLPDGLLSIGEEAFSCCEDLTEVELPNSITKICSNLFFGCNNLGFNENANGLYLGNSENPYLVLFGVKNKEISSCEINEKTKFILDAAFMNCVNLRSIEIPNNITSMGSQVFKNCNNLQDVKFGTNCQLKSIGFEFFYGCRNLISIQMPKEISVIGEYAFFECNSLINIEIPSRVVSIEDNAFYGCQRLERVTFENNSQLSSIGNNAFSTCNSLTSISIPSNVTSIGDVAFSVCSNLRSVSFGTNSQLTSVGEGAFFGCESLTSVVIPIKVSKIGELAFLFGNGNSTIYCEAESKPIGWNDNWTAVDDGMTVVWGYKEN